MKSESNNSQNKVTRREFIKTSAAVSLAALGSAQSRIFAAGSDKIKVGVIGCGNRAIGAVKNCVHADDAVEIVAMGDLFKDRLDRALTKLKTHETEKTDWSSRVPWQSTDKIKVTKETSFTGWDAYKKVLACDIDMVILSSPPHFRPRHLKAAIEAGKHVFMEKPVAVDPAGVKSIIASSELAAQKQLSLVAGTQRRYQMHYRDIIKRIQDGAIGEIVAAQCFWVDRFVRQWGFYHERQPEWSDMEYQMRNWYYFTWLSGDHIVEQHVHNIDIINWAIGAHPVSAMGIGGRQVRTEPQFGNIYDHFAVDFEYQNGIRVSSMCRQTDDCTQRVSERIVGTKGSAYTDLTTAYIEGQNAYKYDKEEPNPYVQEHIELIQSIRKAKPINEGKSVAQSTLSAILGRTSAYTGRALKYSWVMNASKLDYTPEKYEFGKKPVDPVAMPGLTKLV